MLGFFSFLLVLIEQYSAYIIIPTTNFQKVSFLLKNGYSEYVLSYSYISATNSSLSSITIRIFSDDEISVCTYVYDNFTKLIEDKNNFTNYIKKSFPIEYDGFFEFSINNYKNKTFYFSFENKILNINNITCIIYSTETITNIDKSLTSKISYTRNNYAFHYLFKLE